MKRARSRESFEAEMRALLHDLGGKLIVSRDHFRKKDQSIGWQYVAKRRGAGGIALRTESPAKMVTFLRREFDAMFKRKGNPVPASSVESDIKKAAELFHRFTGHQPEISGRVKLPKMPAAVVAIGDIDGIMYSTIRDGRLEKYIHRFKKSSRPLFCASPDGKQLYMLGGAYDFTERGIVDKVR